MAITKTQRVHNYSYSRIGILDLALDNAYPTGGYSLTPADFGLNDVIHVAIEHMVSGLVFRYDYANRKLMAFYPTGGATASPATPAAPQVTSGASSATAVNATTPALTPGQGKELPNNADLSGVTSLRVVAWGS